MWGKIQGIRKGEKRYKCKIIRIIQIKTETKINWWAANKSSSTQTHKRVGGK